MLEFKKKKIGSMYFEILYSAHELGKCHLARIMPKTLNNFLKENSKIRAIFSFFKTGFIKMSLHTFVQTVQTNIIEKLIFKLQQYPEIRSP